MIGAIIGDIVGSVYEFNNIHTKDFPLFSDGCFATDDSIMSIAIAEAILQSKVTGWGLGSHCVDRMKKLGRRYPKCGFGSNFNKWIHSPKIGPYNSCGNGAAMRVSAVAYLARSIDEAKELSRKVTEVTHNHPEGIKGAEATAVAVFMARTGETKEEIKCYLSQYYDLSSSLEDAQNGYKYNETCQGTVPQAILSFLHSTDFEDCIRTAISFGGDSDTLACIAGAIAGAYYGVPKELREIAYQYLTPDLLTPLQIFLNVYCGYKDRSFTTEMAIQQKHNDIFMYNLRYMRRSGLEAISKSVNIRSRNVEI